MKNYLLIASRDPLESNTALEFYHLAINLVALHHQVTLFLVQNAVFPARPSTHSAALARVAAAGAEVLVDEFSLRERGIDPDTLPAGVTLGDAASVVDRLAAGHTAMWN